MGLLKPGIYSKCTLRCARIPHLPGNHLKQSRECRSDFHVGVAEAGDIADTSAFDDWSDVKLEVGQDFWHHFRTSASAFAHGEMRKQYDEYRFSSSCLHFVLPFFMQVSTCLHAVG